MEPVNETQPKPKIEYKKKLKNMIKTENDKVKKE